MHTHGSQGHSSRCLVKTEENSFEYKQRALLETIVTYTFSLLLSFSMWNIASKSYNRLFTPLRLFIALGNAAKVESREAQTEHAKR